MESERGTRKITIIKEPGALIQLRAFNLDIFRSAKASVNQNSIQEVPLIIVLKFHPFSVMLFRFQPRSVCEGLNRCCLD